MDKNEIILAHEWIDAAKSASADAATACATIALTYAVLAAVDRLDKLIEVQTDIAKAAYGI